VTVVDAHCHAGRGDGFTGRWDTRAPLGRYLRRARLAGIGRTVVFAPFAADYGRANRQTAQLVAARPDRLLGFACLHPARDAGSIAAMLDEAVNLGLCGIKVHRHDAQVTREVADSARRLGLPVIFDVQGDIATADLLAAEYPDVDWIVPHLGSFSDDWWAQRCAVELVVRHPNAYTDSSGVRRFDILAEAVRRAPDKVIFGSDGPETHPAVELAKIRAMRLDPAVERAVLGGTIRRLLAKGERRRAAAGLARSDIRRGTTRPHPLVTEPVHGPRPIGGRR
jgi:predicted TIM-barrel fold metal-dependent hydrolase